MSQETKYKCPNCGEVHEEWPALAFDSPAPYHDLPEDMQEEIAELTSDFCIIRHPDQTDRFIRGTLTITVNDHCEDLEYGVWVSLSEKSFEDYSANYNKPNPQATYFGWLNNNIPLYPDTENIPTTVFTRTDGQRPEIVPHEDFDHPLVHDYYHGITKTEAERRIADMISGIAEDES
jgi:hypothetical protein